MRLTFNLMEPLFLADSGYSHRWRPTVVLTDYRLDSHRWRPTVGLTDYRLAKSPNHVQHCRSNGDDMKAKFYNLNYGPIDPLRATRDVPALQNETCRRHDTQKLWHIVYFN